MSKDLGLSLRSIRQYPLQAVIVVFTLGLGIVGAFVLRRAVASQLYKVAALDPGVLLVAAFALFAVAMLACFVPAQRATRIPAADLLRSE